MTRKRHKKRADTPAPAGNPLWLRRAAQLLPAGILLAALLTANAIWNVAVGTMRHASAFDEIIDPALMLTAMSLCYIHLRKRLKDTSPQE